MCMPKYLDSDGVAYLWGKIKHNLNDKMTYYSRTKSDWDSDRTLISEKDVLYIYSDYKVIQKDGQKIHLPGLKIGDGLAYVVDLPFVDTIYMKHITDTDIHITAEERTKWNKAITADVKSTDENLVLSLVS